MRAFLLVGALIAAGAGVATADQASAPASLAAGRIATGTYHTCAELSDGSVRCWGYGAYGALGYGNTMDVGVSQTPASAGPLDLGPGRKAVAITAGSYHTCAILDDGSVRCWGYGGNGRLGFGSTKNVGTTPATTPARVGAVNFGPGRTAKAISAGGAHTCTILDDGSVRCWGFGYQGQLGYGNTNTVGATPATTPAQVGAVNLGPGRTAKAISAGGAHTCAILDDGSVRCWGSDVYGQLGYGNTDTVGDDETPGSVRPVDLGPGRKAVAISAGTDHTCAILDDGGVRCWGSGADGQLGYGNTRGLGDVPATVPARVGPVNLGTGRTAVAISAGDSHTCALLDNGTVRCWGYGADGELGYCNTRDVGNTPASVPGKVGSVNLEAGDSGERCPSTAGHPDPQRAQALRAQGMRRCLARAPRRPARRRGRARRGCLRRYGRTPGPVTTLRARAISRTKILLTFVAPGSDGHNPPAARAYLVEQSRRPIRSAHDLRQARTLCHGSCRFNVTAVGTSIELTITHLAPGTSYYYAVAARDNVSGRLGSALRTGKVRTL